MNQPRYVAEYKSIRGQWLALGSPVKSKDAAVKRAERAAASSYAGRDLRVVVVVTRRGDPVSRRDIVWTSIVVSGVVTS